MHREFKRKSVADRYVLYAQERVFWQAHRGPGRVMDLSIVHYKMESISKVLRAEEERRARLEEWERNHSPSKARHKDSRNANSNSDDRDDEKEVPQGLLDAVSEVSVLFDKLSL